MTTNSALQISQNDLIECVAFFTRSQLFHLSVVHTVFHSLIQQYFPRKPYAPTELAIYTDDECDQLWVAIVIFERATPWEATNYSAQLEEFSICKIIRWIDIHEYNQFDENARAMEKCAGIVEICEDEAHANCPDWHQFVLALDVNDTKGNGNNSNNVESAIFEHFAHFERDKENFAKILKRTTYNPKPELLFPPRLNVIIPVDVCGGGGGGEIYHQLLLPLMSHLDLPFIRLEMVTICDMKPPWWLADDGNKNSSSSQQEGKKEVELDDVAKNDIRKNLEENCYGYSKTDKQINLANQLFNVLTIIFNTSAATVGHSHYKNAQMDSMFAHTELIIKMPLFSELMLLLLLRMQTPNHHQNEQQKNSPATTNLSSTTAAAVADDDDVPCKCATIPHIEELLHAIAIACRGRRFLYFGLENNIMQKLNDSPLKELLWNASNGIFLHFPYNKTNIIEDIVPILYSYNPKSDAEIALKVSNAQGFSIFEQLLGILLKDSLLPAEYIPTNYDMKNGAETFSSSTATYNLKMAIDDKLDTGWKSVIKKINTFMGPWSQWRQLNEEAEQIYIGIKADFVLTTNANRQEQRNGLQFYFRLTFHPTANGCHLKIYRYNISEKAFHEKLRQKAQQNAKWWQRCFQLEKAFDGAAINYCSFCVTGEALFDWQQLVRHNFLRIIDEEHEIQESWTKYIMAKWLDIWRDF